MPSPNLLRLVAATLVIIGSSESFLIPPQLPLTGNTQKLLPWTSQSPIAGSSRPLVDTETLQSRILADRLRKRAEKLYEIAKGSEEEYGHPTRVIGSQGHLDTLNYIASSLYDLGGYYTVSNQSFPAVSGSVFESQLVLGNEVAKSASAMGLTPSTKDKEPVHANLILIQNEGCEASDYPATTNGNIAFVRRGGCAFGSKSELSGRAGAVAAIIYNTEEEELYGNLGVPSPNHVATFGLSGKDGRIYVEKLKKGDSIHVIAYIDAEIKTIVTYNIIAQTVDGDPENCVMLGGHSDSVEEGPGINDDGSGSLSLLEIATQLAQFRVNNCVRFAWWSAEEEGLLGSDYYISALPAEETRKIRLFMDYDMMGSPNFAYQIYDANNEDNPKGSQELKQLYVDWFEDHGLNYTFIPFDGRSDYDAFIRNGIPGGGIATGAEVIKSKVEEGMFGGQAGDAFDECYHQLCDDVENVNLTAWEVTTKLMAHSVATYALSFGGFPNRVDSEVKAQTYHVARKYHGHQLVM